MSHIDTDIFLLKHLINIKILEYTEEMFKTAHYDFLYNFDLSESSVSLCLNSYNFYIFINSMLKKNLKFSIKISHFIKKFLFTKVFLIKQYVTMSQMNSVILPQIFPKSHHTIVLSLQVLFLERPLLVLCAFVFVNASLILQDGVQYIHKIVHQGS